MRVDSNFVTQTAESSAILSSKQIECGFLST
jgi:hypothetical protein